MLADTLLTWGGALYGFLYVQQLKVEKIGQEDLADYLDATSQQL